MSNLNTFAGFWRENKFAWKVGKKCTYFKKCYGNTSQFLGFVICSVDYMLKPSSSLPQFEKWTDSQRKQVLQDCFSRCSASQLKHLRQTLSSWVPEESLDFTRVLPRVISLYVFHSLTPEASVDVLRYVPLLNLPNKLINIIGIV